VSAIRSAERKKRNRVRDSSCGAEKTKNWKRVGLRIGKSVNVDTIRPAERKKRNRARDSSCGAEKA
jgi:hypothetical protein